jgi:uncharacterized Zn finger protein (UPF0148 family)
VPVEVKIKCPKEGEVVFTTSLYTHQIPGTVPCPSCGTDSEVVAKEYIPREESYVRVSSPRIEVKSETVYDKADYGESEPAETKGKRRTRGY